MELPYRRPAPLRNKLRPWPARARPLPRTEQRLSARSGRLAGRVTPRPPVPSLTFLAAFTCSVPVCAPFHNAHSSRLRGLRSPAGAGKGATAPSLDGRARDFLGRVQPHGVRRGGGIEARAALRGPGLSLGSLSLRPHLAAPHLCRELTWDGSVRHLWWEDVLLGGAGRGRWEPTGRWKPSPFSEHQEQLGPIWAGDLQGWAVGIAQGGLGGGCSLISTVPQAP